MGGQAAKAAVQKLIQNTRFEPVAHILWRRLRVRGESGRNARDNALAVRVMARVLRRDSNYVDVGSSYGDLLWHVLRYAPRGRHFAIEPIPEIASGLRAKFPRLTVLEMAASDESGEAEFLHVTSNSGYSGLRRREYPSPDERLRTIRVRTSKLDDVLPADVAVHLLKVDVEGAELQVFRGARRTLTTHRPYLLFEHGRGAATAYGTTPEMVHDFLVRECGLRVSTLEGWLRGEAPLGREAFVAQFQGLECNFLAHP